MQRALILSLALATLTATPALAQERTRLTGLPAPGCKANCTPTNRFRLMKPSELAIDVGGILHGDYRRCRYGVRATARRAGRRIVVTVQPPPRDGRGPRCRHLPILRGTATTGRLEAGIWTIEVRGAQLSAVWSRPAAEPLAIRQDDRKRATLTVPRAGVVRLALQGYVQTRTLGCGVLPGRVRVVARKRGYVKLEIVEARPAPPGKGNYCRGLPRVRGSIDVEVGAKGAVTVEVAGGRVRTAALLPR